jgi:YidC/Oxa1 family membrane protein insertase
MGSIFNQFIYQPLYNLLIFIYNALPWKDFGIAIILVTAIIKILLIPLSRKQIEAQKKMQELQPKIKALQEKYKNNKEKQSQALIELYKENKANPFSGCLPMVVQLVFLIAIYRVLYNISQAGLIVNGGDLYSVIGNPGQINKMFLGIIDLASSLNINQIGLKNIPHVILVLLAAGSQYFQTKMLMTEQKNTGPAAAGQPDFSQMMSKQMLYLGPLLTLFIGVKFPAGLALYWLASTVFMIAQQYYLARGKKTA